MNKTTTGFHTIQDLGMVIAGGGSGNRYGRNNKLLEPLGGIPLFIHSVRRFAALCPPGAAVLVVPAAEEEIFRRLAAGYCPETELNIVAGGETRCRSVANGIEALPDSVRYVAVHDAARPFASSGLLLRCLDAAREYGGALAARRVTDTLKRAGDDRTVVAPVDREGLWAAETPQVFEYASFREVCAVALAAGGQFTDDAGMMTAAGYPVRLVENTENNLKVTYAHDLELAEALLSVYAPEGRT